MFVFLPLSLSISCLALNITKTLLKVVVPSILSCLLSYYLEVILAVLRDVLCRSEERRFVVVVVGALACIDQSGDPFWYIGVRQARRQRLRPNPNLLATSALEENRLKKQRKSKTGYIEAVDTSDRI